MNKAFLKRMKSIRDNVKGYPDDEMRLDVSDFIKLVEMAEQKEIHGLNPSRAFFEEGELKENEE